MLLYHGSRVSVEKPDLAHSRAQLDFGKGFYTTPLKNQAERWCTRFKLRRQSGILSIYEFGENAIDALNVRKFEAYDTEWLDFVMQCRRGLDESEFDIVIGGIANDKVFNTVELYFDDLINKNEALKRLKFEMPNVQYCFRTHKALEALTFVESVNIC